MKQSPNTPFSAPVRMTQYSHGAGCGCKISPRVLDQILHSDQVLPDHDKLLVGNSSRDDAAVYDLGNGQCLIATTDFFMPIVDDPFDFGRIASANAISDVYAMGGSPILAIAILGWPISVLAPEIAREVLEGSRSVCREAGIPLAGGHSIDSPEPIFGLAVNGLVALNHLKKNNTARAGDWIYLTKPVGVGILTTAEKKGLLQSPHQGLAARQMRQLNKLGVLLGAMDQVHAMTDVTGFGLLGHLVEMSEGSGLSAHIEADRVPLVTPAIPAYVEKDCIPGGTGRNWDSYGHKISDIPVLQRSILADPQTSGGLLISVSPDAAGSLEALLKQEGLEPCARPIGRFTERKPLSVYID
ncbi:MAG: selenide, water dikinase SelD [Bacteroidota bacterium]|nr:selenide, water dikinase SelD [Bacteroidota bacterium]